MVIIEWEYLRCVPFFRGIKVIFCWKLHNTFLCTDASGRLAFRSTPKTHGVIYQFHPITNQLIWSEPDTARWPYRALVLETHHQGAHISCGLVVYYDHGFLFRDWSHVITPLCYCGRQITEKPWLETIAKWVIVRMSSRSYSFWRPYVFSAFTMFLLLFDSICAARILRALLWC